ncbi:MAG: hypothetical protein Tsb0034_08710 [Ekhidna sp.]
MEFIPYNKEPTKVIETPSGDIASFISGEEANIDKVTVNSFGAEWSKFNSFTSEEINQVGNDYFDIVDFKYLNPKSTRALDVGCGSGRWSLYIADKVLSIDCIDPSDAVLIAQQNLSKKANARVTKASAEDMPFSDDSFDFVFSLGVLHHIPDTEEALKNCVSKLKRGGYLLIYLYYNLDNRGRIFRWILKIVSSVRYLIARLPKVFKELSCDIIAFTVYLPLIGISKMLAWLFPKRAIYQKVPLSYYIDKSLNVIRNDALDRFGTPLEQRFSKNEIQKMLENAGITNIKFSNIEPYWHAIGQKE